MAGFTIQLVSPEGAETDALLRGLRSRLELAWAAELPEALEEVEVLWVHAGPSDEAPSLGNNSAQLLRAWVLGGGRLLLTGAPASWLGPLGFESEPPALRSRAWQGPIRPTDRLGIAPFLEHPLFERFPGGVYLRRPAGACRLGGAIWSHGRRPVEGRLIGVEKVFLAVQAETGVLVEYAPGNGRVLALGTHLVFEDPQPLEDPFLEARLRFAADLCEFLLFGELESGEAWPEIGRGAEITLDAFDSPAWSESAAATRASHPVLRVEEKEGDPFFDLVDSGAFLALGHAAGLREIWHLPLRLFTDFRLCDDRGQELGKSVDAMLLEAHAVERRFDSLRERVEQSEGAFVYRLDRSAKPGEAATSAQEGSAQEDSAQKVSGREEAELAEPTRTLRISFACDARLLWPYPNALLQPAVEVARDQRSLRLRESTTGRAARIEFAEAPTKLRVSRGERGVLHVEVEFELAFGASFAWRACLDREKGDGLVAPEAAQRTATISVPAEPRVLDPELSASFRQAAQWAELAVERCFLDVEEFGTKSSRTRRHARGYVAGLDLSRPGWCDGRPGPAWIFARDAYWICRATMPLGEAARARAHVTLETLAAFQDPRGGIPHEVTASGLAHYDATDATPLFVDAVIRLLDASEDGERRRAFWPHIERAMAWIFDCDRDGDGLLENGRGHGFVEDGPLRAGIHVELAVVCAQYAALSSSSLLARELGEDLRASEWGDAAARVREVVATRFLDGDAQGFAYGMHADGRFDRRLTAFGVLPVLFDILEPEVAAPLLDVYSTDDFARPEGLRTISRSDRDYDPLGYHRGAAWPFFGALLAWAELRCGLVERGRARLEALAASAGKYGLMPEIVDGETGAPIGVCRHHAAASAAFLGALHELQLVEAGASAS